MTLVNALGTTIVAAALAAAPAAALAQPAASPQPDALKNLKIRNLGPARAGGRVTAVSGIPGKPNIYYVGAAGGGIWKTIDGGATWKAIFTHEATSSIGALAVSASNPQVVWVGTGEANIRNDVTDGRGVYRSTDGGQSWQFMGLKDAGQISTIVINPHDPDDVFVAVVGHAWAPSADRGVFRTTDGGKTWQKVLFVNDQTGASDLVMEPGNPMVLFAGMWQVRRYPWALDDGGPGSGLYRSTDGGTTWKKLTDGLPDGPYGRIAVAVAPSNPNHVYALIEAKTGLLWGSDDMGDHWHAVSDNHEYDVRPFYFSRFYVAPNDENKLYFLSFLLVESDDGGRTVARTDSSVHPDHHALWIDPTDPQRIIQGNDGGVYLTTERRQELDLPRQPAHRAGLHGGHRRPGPLPDLRRPAGQRRLVRAVEHGLSGTGITGGTGSTSSAATASTPCPRRATRTSSTSSRRTATSSGWTSRQPHARHPAVPPGRRTQRNAGRPEVPLQLDGAHRGVAHRGQHGLHRRRRLLQVHRRRRALGGHQPRPHAQRQEQAAVERRADLQRHQRRRDVQHHPVHHPGADRPDRSSGSAPTTAWYR